MRTGRFYLGTVAALISIALSFSSLTTRAAETVSIVSLQSGHSVMLQTPGITRIAIGDGRIVGAVPVGGSQIVVNGKAPGHTTVFVWTTSGRYTYEVTVTEQVMDDLAQMLRTSIQDPNIQVISFNRSVVVRGMVPDGAAFARLTDIISRFDKFAVEQRYTIVNAVTFAQPLGDVNHEISNIPGAGNVRIDPDGKGDIIVSGHVHDMITEQAVLARARGMAGPYLSSEGKVIDRLDTDTTSQVDIKVYVLEVDNTAMKNLGVQLQSAIFQPNNTYLLGPPSFPVVENPVGPGKAFTSGPFFRTITLAPTFNALIQEGHARILSSPDLVTTPGNEATFLVGGQIPIPFSTGLGQIAIVYKDFGVQLHVTPILLANGAVQATINPDISDLDFQDGINENGFLIPALKESRLSTNVITQPGESIVMGGMVRRIEQRTILKIPVLGDIPILGQLFRSVNYQKNDTDIVFVMTPEVITR